MGSFMVKTLQVIDQSDAPRHAKTDLLEIAWGIIANAGGGDWEKESKEWQDAAIRWRDTYFGSLSKVSKMSSEHPNVNRQPNQPSPVSS